MARYITTEHILPNKERTHPIKYLIIHSTTYAPLKLAEILQQEGLSTHYAISQQGEIYEFVDPENVAFHAGNSHWKDVDSTTIPMNEQSIGIEIELPTLGQKESDFTKMVNFRLNWLVSTLVKKYRIREENVIGHSDIAPTRKPDPGCAFPWRKLNLKSLSIWYSLKVLHQKTDELELYQEIGYDLSNINATRYAFCRHFFPEEISINPDIDNLLNNPYPKEFTPKNWNGYIRTLRAVAEAFRRKRNLRYWFEDTPCMPNNISAISTIKAVHNSYPSDRSMERKYARNLKESIKKSKW